MNHDPHVRHENRHGRASDHGIGSGAPLRPVPPVTAAPSIPGAGQIRVNPTKSDQIQAVMNHETHERHENLPQAGGRSRHRDRNSVPSVFSCKIRCFNPGGAGQIRVNPTKSDQIKVDQGSSGPRRLPANGAKRSE